MVGAMGSVFDQGGPRHLLAMHPRGGAPEGLAFVGPRIASPAGIRYSSGMGWSACFDHVAASPDGKWVYLTLSTWRNPHCVFRLDASRWTRPEECLAAEMEEGFVGQVNRPGAGEDRLNDPQGLAVDAKGNLYVCDRGNDRVAVFSADGKFQTAIPVASPEQIGVHRSGAVYVLSRRRLSARQERDFSEMDHPEYTAWLAREDARNRQAGPPKTRLVKFSALGSGEMRDLSALEAPFDLMALDQESDPVRIWASTTAEFPGLTRGDRLYYPEGSTRGELVAVTERDGKLEVGKPVSNENGLRFPWFVAADPARGRALIREHSPHPPTSWGKEAERRKGYKTVVSLDLQTGKVSPFADAAEVVTDAEGTVYAIGPTGGGRVHVLDPSGRKTGEIETRPFGIYANARIGARGYTVAPNGDLYLLRNSKGTSERGTYGRVDIYSPDGKLKKAAVVDGLDAADCGIGVDAAGNIYLGANLHLAGRPFPDGFDGKIPARNWHAWLGSGSRGFPWDYMCANYYLFAWGSVLKFGPEGGAYYGRGSVWHTPKPDDLPLASVANAPADAVRYRSPALDKEVAVRGAHWRFQGVGPVPTTAVNFGDASCMCTTSRLAVDPWGRVFAPDVFRFSVWVLDTNGNRLHRIGRYGNTDDGAQELRFAWPSFVDEADGKLYVLDNLNRRVSVVAFDYAASRECPIP